MATFTLNQADTDTLGFVRVSWPSSQEAGNWYLWRVYRRPTGTSTWTKIHEVSTKIVGTYLFDDYLFQPNVSQDYSVVQVTTNDGGQTVTEGSYDVQTITPVSVYYWLVHPFSPALTFRLSAVNADSFEETFEEEELLVIGRGRKVDRGDNWGINGTLSVKFRDNLTFTGAQQRRAFSLLRADASHLFLRDPFGEVTKVALFGNTTYEREAGVGLREFVAASVQYRQVA